MNELLGICDRCGKGFSEFSKSHLITHAKLKGVIRELRIEFKIDVHDNYNALCPRCCADIVKDVSDKIRATECTYYTVDKPK